MSGESSVGPVPAAYAARADEYVAALGTIEVTASEDRDLVLGWARGVDGPVLDVGCGPGHWTHYLRGAGVDAEGIDPVAGFVESARATYPTVSYRLGRAEQLDVADASLGGILSWYSLIHLPPEEIDAPLAEFARCLSPGGSLVLGFFTGPRLEPFEHAVTTAYFWPLEAMVSRLEHAGFAVVHTKTRANASTRPHGAIVASRG